MPRPLSQNQKLIRRILRVNHAGEHGAVSIYSAQLKRLPVGGNDLEVWLKETMSHEKEHRLAFREAMSPRFAKPCRALSVWSVGGWLLGSITSMWGRTGILACTAAVERTVHAHLEEQIAFLRHHDSELATLVERIQFQEISHLSYAEEGLGPESGLAASLRILISCATEVLIALSTRGDSIRLRYRLRAAIE
ncbi:demethoxyubiquinone hydroxylase family protein [Asticcacaulis currens]|uniref:demethoxyubiquinone hydroxylase family protein n=1 Tax=Asticcacaulis currens TaxID=2984210 RepID=UPI0034A10A78